MLKIKERTKYNFLLLLLLFLNVSCDNSSDVETLVYEEPDGTPQGTALIITGAAARITHELALLERLDELGELDDLVFISGVSSGAIMTITLNGILKENSQVGWESVKNYIFSLKQEDLLSNPRNTLPVDTRGIWNTFESFFKDSFNITSFKDDLQIPSALTAVRLDNRELVKVSNIDEFNSITDNAAEGLMASTSFPAVFPAIRINNLDYVDGGLVENVPYSAALKYELLRKIPYEKVIIVSFQKNTNTLWNTELDLLSLSGKKETIIEELLELSGFSLDVSTNESFLRDLTIINTTYPTFGAKTVVYTPKILNPPYFPTFQFDGGFSEEVYDIMRSWALENSPVQLDDFLNQ